MKEVERKGISPFSKLTVAVLAVSLFAFGSFYFGFLLPVQTKGELESRCAHNAPDAIQFAESVMRDSGYAGVPNLSLVPTMDEMVYLTNGALPPFRRLADAWQYQPKASAWDDAGDRWIVFFAGQRDKNSGMQVDILKNGGYLCVYDPGSALDRFAHKI